MGDVDDHARILLPRYADGVSDPTTPPIEPRAGGTQPVDQHDGHLIQQAEVPPLDVDGVQAAVAGTVVFAVVTAVLAVGYDRLVAADDGWWLGVALSGLLLGLLGIAYTVSRRRRRRRRDRTARPA